MKKLNQDTHRMFQEDVAYVLPNTACQIPSASKRRQGRPELKSAAQGHRQVEEIQAQKTLS